MPCDVRRSRRGNFDGLGQLIRICVFRQLHKEEYGGWARYFKIHTNKLLIEGPPYKPSIITEIRLAVRFLLTGVAPYFKIKISDD